MNRQTISNWISDDKDIPYHRQSLIASVYLLAFIMPFSGLLTSYSIVLSVLCLIISGILSFPFKIKWSADSFLLPVLYCLYAISMFYTKNQQSGWSELGTKFTLLLLPFFFLVAVSFIKFNTRKIIWLFVMGCFISGIFCLVVALVHFLSDNDINDFFYKQLSVIMHPGYYAMYLNFALAFLGWEILTRERSAYVSPLFMNPLIIFFSLFVILLSSKLAIILLFISIFAFLVIVLLQKRKDKAGYVIRIFILTIMVITALYFSKDAIDRFGSLKQVASYSTLNPSTEESTGLRIEIWKSTIKIMKDHWLLGTGTGDLQEALQKRYKELGITKAAELNLNTHNQYLQTFLGIGIAGLILLLFITFGTLFRSLFTHKYLLAAFLFIVIFNFLIEAVLQRQAGVIFFSFFYSLLFLTEFNKSKM